MPILSLSPKCSFFSSLWILWANGAVDKKRNKKKSNFIAPRRIIKELMVTAAAAAAAAASRTSGSPPPPPCLSTIDQMSFSCCSKRGVTLYPLSSFTTLCVCVLLCPVCVYLLLFYSLIIWNQSFFLFLSFFHILFIRRQRLCFVATNWCTWKEKLKASSLSLPRNEWLNFLPLLKLVYYFFSPFPNFRQAKVNINAYNFFFSNKIQYKRRDQLIVARAFKKFRGVVGLQFVIIIWHYSLCLVASFHRWK